MVTDQIPTIKKSRLVRIGRVVFCWKTIIIHIDIIIHIIISALIVKTVHNVEAWWCGCKVQIGRSGIWDRAILPHLHVLGQCGAHLVKVNINTTSKLTNFGTYLATVNLNFNINLNVTSISWAGQ